MWSGLASGHIMELQLDLSGTSEAHLLSFVRDLNVLSLEPEAWRAKHPSRTFHPALSALEQFLVTRGLEFPRFASDGSVHSWVLTYDDQPQLVRGGSLDEAPPRFPAHDVVRLLERAPKPLQDSFWCFVLAVQAAAWARGLHPYSVLEAPRDGYLVVELGALPVSAAGLWHRQLWFQLAESKNPEDVEYAGRHWRLLDIQGYLSTPGGGGLPVACSVTGNTDTSAVQTAASPAAAYTSSDSRPDFMEPLKPWQFMLTKTAAPAARQAAQTLRESTHSTRSAQLRRRRPPHRATA